MYRAVGAEPPRRLPHHIQSARGWPPTLNPDCVPMRVVTQVPHETRTQRVGHDVPGNLLDIFVTSQRTIMETALPDHTPDPVRGHGFHRSHHNGQRATLTQSQQPVQVIRHQHIGHRERTTRFLLLLQTANQAPSPFEIGEDRLTLTCDSRHQIALTGSGEPPPAQCACMWFPFHGDPVDVLVPGLCRNLARAARFHRPEAGLLQCGRRRSRAPRRFRPEAGLLQYRCRRSRAPSAIAAPYSIGQRLTSTHQRRKLNRLMSWIFRNDCCEACSAVSC